MSGKGRKTILQLYLVFPVCVCFSVKFGHSSQPGVSMEQGGVRAGSKTRNSNRFCHHDYLYLIMFILILKEWVQEVWGGGERCRRGRRLSKGPKVNIVPSRGKIIALSLIIVIVFFNIFFIVQSSSLVLFNLLLDPRSIFWIVSHHQSKLYWQQGRICWSSCHDAFKPH